MSNENTDKYKKKIVTIPNMISFFRLCLLPVIIWLYCIREDYLWSVVLVVVSGISDVIDGKIARRFNMVSDLGKVLDPVADKLTQIAVAFCLASRFPLMGAVFVVLTVKEIFAAVFNLVVIKVSGQVTGALWHGKVCTVLLYLTMILHLVWLDIPAAVSDVLAVCCCVMLLVSAGMYTGHNVKVLKKVRGK